MAGIVNLVVPILLRFVGALLRTGQVVVVVADRDSCRGPRHIINFDHVIFGAVVLADQDRW